MQTPLAASPALLQDGGLSSGLYDVAVDLYHARHESWPLTLSYSTAKVLINQSPLHAWHDHPQLGGCRRAATDEMDLGQVAHQLIVGKGRGIEPLDYPDFRTKAAQAERDEIRATGSVPILAHKLAAAMALEVAFKRQVMESEAASFYAPEALSEVAAYWQPADCTDVYCQSMFDRVNLATGEIFDVKTTTSAHPKSCAAKISTMGYDIQAEFYRAALETLRPELAGRTRFVFLFAETAAPHVVTPVELSGEGREIARMRMERAVDTWRHCVMHDTWPAYSREIISVEPPGWALAEEIAAAA